MITDIFTNLQTAGGAFIDWLSNLLSSVGALIYTPGVGEVPGSFTFVGTFILIAVAIGVVALVIRWVMHLVRLGR